MSKRRTKEVEFWDCEVPECTVRHTSRQAAINCKRKATKAVRNKAKLDSRNLPTIDAVVDVWERHQRGMAISAIAKLYDVQGSCIQSWLVQARRGFHRYERVRRQLEHERAGGKA
jgi:hypothetical protein